MVVAPPPHPYNLGRRKYKTVPILNKENIFAETIQVRLVNRNQILERFGTKIGISCTQSSRRGLRSLSLP